MAAMNFRILPLKLSIHYKPSVGFHASHARNAAWTELPLSGSDREREVLSG